MANAVEDFYTGRYKVRTESPRSYWTKPATEYNHSPLHVLAARGLLSVFEFCFNRYVKLLAQNVINRCRNRFCVFLTPNGTSYRERKLG